MDVRKNSLSQNFLRNAKLVIALVEATKEHFKTAE